MRTEAQFYEEHLADLIDILTTKINPFYIKCSMDDQDEMELDALGSLLQDVERLY